MRADESGGIVEAKNASARQKRIGEVNAGVYCFAADALATGARADPEEPGRRGVLPDRRRRDPRLGQGPGRGDRGGRLAGGLGSQHAPGPRGRRGDGAAPRRRPRPRCGRDRARPRDRAHRSAGPAWRRTSCCTPSCRLEGETTLEEGARSCPSRGSSTRVSRPGRSSGRTASARGRRSAPRARVGPFSRLRPGLGDRGGRPRSATSSRPRTRALRPGRQGAAPLLPRRRGDRRRREHRGGRHHLQLRRREEAPDDDRRGGLHRQRLPARRPRDGRRRGLRGRRARPSPRTCPTGPWPCPGRPRPTRPAGPPGARRRSRTGLKSAPARLIARTTAGPRLRLQGASHDNSSTRPVAPRHSIEVTHVRHRRLRRTP